MFQTSIVLRFIYQKQTREWFRFYSSSSFIFGLWVRSFNNSVDSFVFFCFKFESKLQFNLVSVRSTLLLPMKELLFAVFPILSCAILSMNTSRFYFLFACLFTKILYFTFSPYTFSLLSLANYVLLDCGFCRLQCPSSFGSAWLFSFWANWEN